MTEKAYKKKRINADYGMTDYYNYYAKNTKNPVSRQVFNKTVSLFNLAVMREILDNYKVYTIPHLYLKIGIRKSKPRIRFKDGVVVNGNPIDWATTNKLWEENEEAKKNRVLVRHTNKHTFGYVFKIYVLKFAARFKNRSVFKFRPIRRFQRELSKRIQDESKERFDCHLLFKED